jgi:hypothetical protein
MGQRCRRKERGLDRVGECGETIEDFGQRLLERIYGEV